jgi:hypothetical protein
MTFDIYTCDSHSEDKCIVLDDRVIYVGRPSKHPRAFRIECTPQTPSPLER